QRGAGEAERRRARGPPRRDAPRRARAAVQGRAEDHRDVRRRGLSLGQKQMVAFIRAVMREPDLLILDEATANIDTVTEQLLEDILRDLPPSTTKVVIAHRLNT